MAMVAVSLPLSHLIISRFHFYAFHPYLTYPVSCLLWFCSHAQTYCIWRFSRYCPLSSRSKCVPVSAVPHILAACSPNSTLYLLMLMLRSIFTVPLSEFFCGLSVLIVFACAVPFMWLSRCNDDINGGSARHEFVYSTLPSLPSYSFPVLTYFLHIFHTLSSCILYAYSNFADIIRSIHVECVHHCVRGVPSGWCSLSVRSKWRGGSFRRR